MQNKKWEIPVVSAIVLIVLIVVCIFVNPLGFRRPAWLWKQRLKKELPESADAAEMHLYFEGYTENEKENQTAA